MNNIIFHVENHVATITLSRPEAGNRITEEMAADLETLVLKINLDDSVYVVFLEGAGKDFCIGADFEPGRCHPAASLAAIDRPIFAAVNGQAAGEGLEMALACDLRLAEAQARFVLPQIGLGRLPADGATQRLPRIVGKARALEMLLLAEPVSAEEALAIGLVNRVCADLKAESLTLAAAIAAKAPVSARFVKEAVNKGLDLTLDQGIRLEEDLYFLLHTTADRTEGIHAFLEKRPPEYKNR